MQGATTKKAVMRWHKPETYMLLVKWLQAQVIGGPHCTSPVIPWSRIGGFKHKGSALARRISHFKTNTTHPSELEMFKNMESLAHKVFASRTDEQREQLMTKLKVLTTQLLEGAKNGADPPPQLSHPMSDPANSNGLDLVFWMPRALTNVMDSRQVPSRYVVKPMCLHCITCSHSNDEQT